METTLDRGGLTASAMPLCSPSTSRRFPATGRMPALLFGFLFLIDAAMLAIGLARSSGTEAACLRATSPHRTSRAPARRCSCSRSGWRIRTREARGRRRSRSWRCSCAFYLFAPLVAARVKRAVRPDRHPEHYAAPLLLFVFPVIAAIEPAVPRRPAVRHAVRAARAIAWRALAAPDSLLYFIAAFFAVAAEAKWSATISLDRHARSRHRALRRVRRLLSRRTDAGAAHRAATRAGVGRGAV
jgi:hypothetical protein